jgi:CBS domain-containing protein
VIVKIRDVYRPAVVTCPGDEPLRTAARRMVEADTGVLVVVDGGTSTGLLTERDVVRAVAAGPDPGDAPAAQYATRSVITTDLDEDTETAARRMLAEGVRRLPVLGPDGDVVGIVSMRDLFAVEVLATPGPGPVPGA